MILFSDLSFYILSKIKLREETPELKGENLTLTVYFLLKPSSQLYESFHLNRFHRLNGSYKNGW